MGRSNVTRSDGRMGGKGIRNPSSRSLGEFYRDTPKAVFAAIAYDLARDVFGNDLPADSADQAAAIRAFLLSRWWSLNARGTVPQIPPAGNRAVRAARNRRAHEERERVR